MLEKERKRDHSIELICEPKLGLQVLGQVLKGGGVNRENMALFVKQ